MTKNTIFSSCENQNTTNYHANSSISLGYEMMLQCGLFAELLVFNICKIMTLETQWKAFIKKSKGGSDKKFLQFEHN